MDGDRHLLSASGANDLGRLRLRVQPKQGIGKLYRISFHDDSPTSPTLVQLNGFPRSLCDQHGDALVKQGSSPSVPDETSCSAPSVVAEEV